MQYIHPSAELFWGAVFSLSISQQVVRPWVTEISFAGPQLWPQHSVHYSVTSIPTSASLWIEANLSHQILKFESLWISNKQNGQFVPAWHMLFQWVKYSGETEPLSFLWLIPLLSCFLKFPVHKEIIMEDITAQRASIYDFDSNQWRERVWDNQTTSEISVHYQPTLSRWLPFVVMPFEKPALRK